MKLELSAEIVDTLRESLLVLDSSLRVLHANRAFYRTFAVSPEETEGQPLRQLGNGQWDIPRLHELLNAILPERTTVEDFVVEHRFEHVGRRVMLLNARRLAHEATGEERILLAIEDVTERRAAEERELAARREAEERAEALARSNAELERFAYVASHDLQEPLRMISSYTQLLARRYEGQLDEQADRYIHYAVDGAARMQALINALLVYSRVGRQQRTFDPVPAEDLLARAVQALDAAHAESGAEITHDPLPVVRGDATQLGQVFQNLIGNAIKFRGDAAPRVHVSARPDEGGLWRFSVRDNGIGIDPEYFDRVFVMFQRLHTRDEYPGTGLGLALCRKIVEHHGGRMWVESAPGEGSTFYFTLPGEAD